MHTHPCLFLRPQTSPSSGQTRAKKNCPIRTQTHRVASCVRRNPNRHPSRRHFPLSRRRTAPGETCAYRGTISHLQVGVVLIGEGHSGGGVHLLLVLGEEGLVDLDLRGREGEAGDELKGLVADEFPGEPEEGLLEVVVGLCRDVVVLEVLLSVEGDGLGLDLALLHVDLVAGEDDGDVLADADKITWGQSVSVEATRSLRETYGASWERSCR